MSVRTYALAEDPRWWRRVLSRQPNTRIILPTSQDTFPYPTVLPTQPCGAFVAGLTAGRNDRGEKVILRIRQRLDSCKPVALCLTTHVEINYPHHDDVWTRRDSVTVYTHHRESLHDMLVIFYFRVSNTRLHKLNRKHAPAYEVYRRTFQLRARLLRLMLRVPSTCTAAGCAHYLLVRGRTGNCGES